jgi:DNA mismatch repair protein MutS2
MFTHTKKVLEYDKFKSLLKKYASSQLGVSWVEALSPLYALDEIRRQQALCSESKTIYQIANGFPLNGLKDITPFLHKASKPGAILEPTELLEIGRILRSAKNVKRAMGRQNRADFPNLVAIVDNLLTAPDLAESIDRCISPEGDICDDASPTLRTIRRQLVSTRENLLSKLESFLRSSHHQKYIQENVITSRNDRYVIPIKQDARSHFPGSVIQGTSASGATVFVEPSSIVELNNDLHELVDKEIQEIRRILLELTDEVREYVPDLELALEILGQLDLFSAKARFSITFDCVEPRLNERGFLKLIQARHPLLEDNLRQRQKADDLPPTPDLSSQVIPTDVHLGDSFHSLVITGPNTGGKTVVLKTVGLLTLMAQSGLHIPAKPGSEIAIFDQIFADIGDEQSIEQNLSTFSSHITKIVETLKHVENGNYLKHSLVLFDEIGAGTEPTEGAALGMSILDWLTEREVRAIVTTHYGALKAYAHTREGVENASMEFDAKTLSPTYRLQIGLPGSSNAMQIAQRLGMPESILAAAKSQIGNQKIAVEDLIVSMQQSQRELEAERAIVQEKIRASETAHKEHEEKLRQFEAERDERIEQAEREAFDVLKEARRLVEQTVAEIRREQASKDSIRSAFSRVEDTKEKFKQRLQRRKKQPKPSEKITQVIVGDKVRVKSLNRFGEVTAVAKNSHKPLKVQVGNMQMQLTYGDIEPVQPEQNNRKLSPSILDIQHSKVNIVGTELNLLGKTVNEGLEEVDKYLDDAFLAGLPTVRLVHGKGTGALRSGVHDFLRGHPLVKDFRLAARNEGAEGATVVTLKE